MGPFASCWLHACCFCRRCSACRRGRASYPRRFYNLIDADGDGILDIYDTGVIKEQGSIASGGSYDLKYFKQAEPAHQRIATKLEIGKSETNSKSECSELWPGTCVGGIPVDNAALAIPGRSSIQELGAK